jgi:hypothetical protein
MAINKPLGPSDEYCPEWKKPMSKVCHRCRRWIQVRGTNPQTGAEVDEWNCAMAILPMLLIDNSRVQRGTQAATESMRNEVVKRMDADLMMRANQAMRMTNGEDRHLELEDHS